MNQKLRKETVAVHGGSRKDDAFGAINEPIYMTSNYRIPTDGTPERHPQQYLLPEPECEPDGPSG